MKTNKFHIIVIVLLLTFVGILIRYEMGVSYAFTTDLTVEDVTVATQPEATAPAEPESETEFIDEMEAIPAFASEEPAIISYEQFMSGIYDKYSRESYEKLFELYDYEQFMQRSEIPQYFQTLYTTPFASGTIRSSGCGITCLAMITTYLYDQTITPDMLTLGYRKDNPASVLERLVTEDYLDIRMDKYYGNDAVTQFDAAMENGNPVIMLHRAPSIFTQGGHFIVVTGMTEDGRYIVNDPNLENVLDPKYADEYMNGFTRDQLLYGLVGTYVFDTKADFDGDPSRIPHR